MATIPNTAVTLKDYTVKIDADNFEAAVSQVLLTPPSPSSTTWSGPSGVDLADESANGPWTCQLDYVQDWTNDDSLAAYLFDHAGETKSVVFTPIAGTGLPKFTADVVLRSGPVGGTTRQFPTSSVTMTCATAPVRGVTV